MKQMILASNGDSIYILYWELKSDATDIKQKLKPEDFGALGYRMILSMCCHFPDRHSIKTPILYHSGRYCIHLRHRLIFFQLDSWHMREANETLPPHSAPL